MKTKSKVLVFLCLTAIITLSVYLGFKISGYSTYPGAGGCQSIFPSGNHDFNADVNCNTGFGTAPAYVINSNDTNINCNGHLITGDLALQDAFYLNNVTSNISISNCYLRSGLSILSISNSTNSLVKDSNLTTSGATWDLKLASSTNITLLNVTFNYAKQSISSDSNYTRQWYLDVQLSWTNGTAIPGATVTAFNATEAIYGGTTDGSGRIRFIANNYFRNGAAITNYSTYNITANFSYDSNSTTTILDTNRLIQIFMTQSDHIAPTIQLTSDHIPEFAWPDPQEPGKNVTISANVSDNSGVSEVTINLSGPAGTSNYYYSKGNITKDGDAYYIQFTPSQFGVYNYTIWANDTSNNQNQTTGNFTVKDLWPPWIGNITLSPSVLGDAGLVEYINATVIDDFSIGSIWAQIIYPNGNTQNFSMSNSSSIYNLTFTTTTQRGEYQIIIYANDTFNNLANTADYDYKFYVPPYIYTDRYIYSLGQNVIIRGVGFSSAGATINLTITNESGFVVSGMPIATLVDGSRAINFSWTVPYTLSDGTYHILVTDPNYAVTISADFELRAYYKEYSNGTIVIPMDGKQSTNANDLDFLRAYGFVWKLLNSSIGVDWVFTPPCVTLNSTTIGGGQKYNEKYCYGFFLIDNSSVWPVISSYWGDSRFSGIVLHNLSSSVRIRQNQITQLSKAPRIALWNRGEEIVDQTLNESYIPYTLINKTQILNGGLNTSSFDIFLVGHYDFLAYINQSSPSEYKSLTGNISKFLQSSGDMHAECVGADSLDASGKFIGNVTRGPAIKGNIRIINDVGFQLTQTHASTTSNVDGLTPTLNITKAPSGILIHAVDSNWPYSDFTHQVGRNEIVKFISKDIGTGYISYAGGHLGQVRYECDCTDDCYSCWQTTALAIPRNRILDNLVFFGSYVNDQSPPSIDTVTLMPTPGDKVYQFRPIVLYTSASDNNQVSAVWASILFGSYNQTTYMDGPYYPLNYTTIFRNTSYVINKYTNTTYNITFYANDSDGNLVNATSWFVVIPDQIPKWSNNVSTPNSIYSANQSTFNITWTDDFGLDSVTINNNFSGPNQNSSMTCSGSLQKNCSYSIKLPAGNYIWKVYANDSYSQSNETDMWSFTISKAASNLTLVLNSQDENVTITEGQYVNISSRKIAGESDMGVYLNGTTISSSPSADNITQFNTAGTYNITAIHQESQNYTPSSDTHYVIVSPASSGSGGGNSGGGGGGSTTCTSIWNCTQWSDCGLIFKTRICSDLNQCSNPPSKPSEREVCLFETPPANTTEEIQLSPLESIYGWACRRFGYCNLSESSENNSQPSFYTVYMLYLPCTIPWTLILILFITLILFMLFSEKFDEKARLKKIYNQMKIIRIKAWLAGIVDALAIYLYYHPCMPFQELKIALIIIIAYCSMAACIYIRRYYWLKSLINQKGKKGKSP